jgi:ATP-dependent DNA helicase RecQ
LTIENENGKRTLRISQWLHEDPITFDKIRRKYNIRINKEIFSILVSKLRANHPIYFRDALGLNVRIEFKGYDHPIKAIIPYDCNPVEFYKWWCANQNLINMTFSEKIMLFDRVLLEEPDSLKKEHRKMIEKRL